MEIVSCPHCESVLLEYYQFDDGMEKCVCRHCGEWESKSIKAGDLVRHEDAAYSEIFTVLEVRNGGHIIQGPKPKYEKPFFTESRLYLVKD